MTELLMVGGGIVLVMILAAWFHLLKERGELVRDLMAANARLVQENQRLVESMCQSAGHPVKFTPPVPEETNLRSNRPPYFQSKQPRTVQVLDKTVQL